MCNKYFVSYAILKNRDAGKTLLQVRQTDIQFQLRIARRKSIFKNFLNPKVRPDKPVIQTSDLFRKFERYDDLPAQVLRSIEELPNVAMLQYLQRHDLRVGSDLIFAIGGHRFSCHIVPPETRPEYS